MTETHQIKLNSRILHFNAWPYLPAVYVSFENKIVFFYRRNTASRTRSSTSTLLATPTTLYKNEWIRPQQPTHSVRTCRTNVSGTCLQPPCVLYCTVLYAGVVSIVWWPPCCACRQWYPRPPNPRELATPYSILEPRKIRFSNRQRAHACFQIEIGA